MADGGGDGGGGSVNSQAESRKHTDECGVDGNTEEPGLRARGQAGAKTMVRGGGGSKAPPPLLEVTVATSRKHTFR